MNFTIIGAGALGSLIGGSLAEKGNPVFLIGREAHIQALNKNKLVINGVRGTKEIAVSGDTNISKIPFQTDVFILTVKLGDTEQALMQLKEHIAQDTIFLSFQNGIPIDVISKTCLNGLVLAAVTGWAATMNEPGIISHTSDGSFVVGGYPVSMSKIGENKISLLINILNQISPTILSDNIYGHLWIKLLIASLYSVLAVGGYTFGDVITDNRIKRILFKLWQEGYHTAKAMGIQLEPYLDQLQPEMLLVNSIPDYVRASFVIDFMLKDRKTHRPSVLIDLEKGRKTEIPFLNGYIETQARKHHLQTPMHSRVIKMIQEIEAGRRKISKANIQILFKNMIFEKEKSH